MQDQWAKFHLVIQGSKEILGSSPDKFQGLEICQVILDNIREEKNPRDDWVNSFETKEKFKDAALKAYILITFLMKRKEESKRNRGALSIGKTTLAV